VHEAGIAIAVAAEVRDRGLDPSRVRLLVTGGHGDLGAFDAALVAHLEAAAPGAGLGRVRIVHLATPRLCARCAVPFQAIDEAVPCPACGGPAIAAGHAESIELAWDEAPSRGMPGGGGPDDPPADDSRLSTPAVAGGSL
jgi:hypothetical protein